MLSFNIIIILRIISLKSFKHFFISWLLSEFFIKWKAAGVFGILVGEVPCFESSAIWLLKANLKNLAIDGGLGFEGALRPVSPLTIFHMFRASDVGFCELDLYIDVRVSLNVLSDGLVICLIIIDVDVVLEAHTIDRAFVFSSLLHNFNNVENFIRFGFIVSLH